MHIGSHVKSVIQVASPPGKPVMIHDGDCEFCSLWIRRWQKITGDLVDYVPSQDAQVASCFPEVPKEMLTAAVQLVETDGCVYGGAEAVFRSLARGGRDRWLLKWYEESAAFAHASEWCYGVVARNRWLFSRLTRLGWGRNVEPSK